MDSHTGNLKCENHYFSYRGLLVATLVAATAIWSAATVQTTQAQQRAAAQAGKRPNILVTDYSCADPVSAIQGVNR